MKSPSVDRSRLCFAVLVLGGGAAAIGIVLTLLFAVGSGLPPTGKTLATTLVGLLALTTVAFVWWFTRKPSNTRAWRPEVSRAPWAEIDGDRATIHEVRNFAYRTETDFTPCWETRVVDLSQITGADLFLTHWGIPGVAHSIVSFGFTDGTFLATSVEARKTVDQEYSSVRGFFRQYEVIYLIADERDVVRVRTNYRAHENVYLYRTRLTPADARGLFTAYLSWMNTARREPEWYNALTQNCGSRMIAHLARNHIGGVSRRDWRGLLGGHGDKMLYDLGDLVGAQPFAQLKAQAWINRDAQAADDAPDFSRRIRKNRTGFI